MKFQQNLKKTFYFKCSQKIVNKRREKTALGCAVEAAYPRFACFFLHAASSLMKNNSR
jgi:hypothetical protein